MDALNNFTKEEILAAFSEHVAIEPNKRPNEGHIRKIILSNRAADITDRPKPSEAERGREEFDSKAILEEIGFTPRRFP